MGLTGPRSAAVVTAKYYHRWIRALCHNLRPVTPTANTVALYETIRENGKL
jgi:hypothetical protein